MDSVFVLLEPDGYQEFSFVVSSRNMGADNRLVSF